MNNIRGMTIAQFKSALAEMHTIYPFEDDSTYFGSTEDCISRNHSRVEIYTEDKSTNVHICMYKNIEVNYE